MLTNNQILISEIIKRDSSENPQYKNADIKGSLEHSEGEDFWRLNNGIAILAESANFVPTEE